jgi:hypothetical protein
MDVKNVTGGILIFLVRDRISVPKFLNVIMTIRLHKFFRFDSKITDEIPWPQLYVLLKPYNIQFHCFVQKPSMPQISITISAEVFSPSVYLHIYWMDVLNRRITETMQACLLKIMALASCACNATL